MTYDAKLKEMTERLWYTLPLDAVMFYAHEPDVRGKILTALEQARDLGSEEAHVAGMGDGYYPREAVQKAFERGREEERKALREIVLSDTCMPNCFHDECARSRSIFTRIAALDEEPA